MSKQEPAGSGAAIGRTYGVELLYETLPPIRKGDLLDALRRRGPDIVPIDGNRDSGPLAFLHRDHLVEQGGQRLPVQTLILTAERIPDPMLQRASLEQSWSWPQAAAVLPRCRAAVMVADILASGLHYLERLVLFENALVSALEAYPPLAVHWRPTQQFVEPLAFLSVVRQAGGLVLTPGPINVRVFRPEEPASSGEPEFFLDTLGLAVLGLPDLQCHFRGLDPMAVSRLLYNTAVYQFEHGPVIEDGHTIPGIAPEERWTCHRKNSLSLPDRPVIELDPGPSHSVATP